MSNLRKLESDKLIVSTSLIPNAGRGLFAKKVFTKGEIIGEYTGKVFWLGDKDLEKLKGKTTYFMEKGTKNKQNKLKYIDGHPDYEESGLLSFANDAYSTKFQNNASFIETKTKIIMVCEKRIPKGAEILVDYGDQYWESDDDSDED